MDLATFIEQNMEPVVGAWVAFASTLRPAAEAMDQTALRDDAVPMLQEIVADMRRPQSEGERDAKSQGCNEVESEGLERASRAHARQRARHGFDINQLHAEYRALRATVLKLWVEQAESVRAEDVEDVTRFNEALDQSVSEAVRTYSQQVETSRDLLLGVLGHDLRTPLGVIVNCANVQIRTSPASAQSMRMILRNAAYMGALVNDVVEFTRSRLGLDMALQPEAFDLDRFVSQAIAELMVDERHHTIDLVAEGDLRVTWDAHKVRQVVCNLLINALKYGQRGTPIDMRLDGRGKDEVLLTVHNAGDAIAPDLLAHLFEPLVRSETAPAAPHGANMGLGLFIAQQTVQAHSGTIDVTSTAHGGTTFVVCMPRHLKEAGTPTQAA